MRLMAYVLAWIALNVVFAIAMMLLGAGVWAFHLGMIFGAATQVFLFMRYSRL